MIMKKAVFDDEGFPLAFYWDELHGDNIPGNAIEVTDEQWAEFIENSGLRRWVNGEIVAYSPSQNLTISDYESAVQDMIDATARERDYRSGDSLASFALSTTAKWAGEAQAFIAWRDNVWRYVYGEREKFLSGQRQQPAIGTFLSEIAHIVWPTV